MPIKKPIIVEDMRYETSKEYSSIKEASRALHISRDLLGKYARGLYKNPVYYRYKCKYI